MNMKKILSLMLLMAAACGLAKAHDFVVTLNGQKVYFNIVSEKNRTVEITYNGSIADEKPTYYEGELAVPAKVRHNNTIYSVAGIGAKAFCGADRLTGIVLPEGLKAIGDFAFEGCTSLERIIFPGGSVKFGEGVFFKCDKIQDVSFGSDWKEVDLKMFRWSDSLVSITIPAKMEKIHLESAGFTSRQGFILENLNRIREEISSFEKQKEALKASMDQGKEEIIQKENQISQIEETIKAGEEETKRDQEKMKAALEKKEEMTRDHKGFFAKRDELSSRMNLLDKESYRLQGQKEKLEEEQESQTSYMWEEYEMTYGQAKEQAVREPGERGEIKKQIQQIKTEIRQLGNVNVNAIEEYKEISQRHDFMKTQHEDLVKSEETLMGIIEELDTGMRRQFEEKFAQIRIEFDKAFKELFGGGKGTIELDEEEDILEAGIRIISQPPGKKLQNMMQLSGGEKALTAIALLFAIQNLKPSPFCLLDEIEAALDDSNVTRYAQYLHKLTKNTQFIIITHRRGTMTAADRLYGITMQEKGVSTLVSVDLIEHDLDK